MILQNASLLTMDTQDFPNGYLRILNGKIHALGSMEECPEPAADEEVLSLGGRTVMPGFVDAHSHLGLIGDGMGVEGDDANEDADPTTPHLRALDGINPMDRCFEAARKSGVTCAVVSPGSANPIAGQVCAVKTTGRWIDRMTVAQPLAIKFALGENPKMTYGGKSQSPLTRLAIAGIIREQLGKAKRYLEDWEASQEDDELAPPDFDARCEALIPLLRGDIAAHFHAHKAYDILTAVRIAEEFGLQYSLIHCTEGYLIADILAELSAPAVCGPLICARTKPELAGLSLDNCAKMMEAGIPVAISTDHPEVPVEFLASSAAVAVTGGMRRDDALRTITVNAAKTARLDHRVGRLAPGLDGDVLVFSGDPLGLGVQPEMVWIEGVRVV